MTAALSVIPPVNGITRLPNQNAWLVAGWSTTSPSGCCIRARPVAERFCQTHPYFIDLVFWPKMRANMIEAQTPFQSQQRPLADQSAAGLLAGMARLGLVFTGRTALVRWKKTPQELDRTFYGIIGSGRAA